MILSVNVNEEQRQRISGKCLVKYFHLGKVEKILSFIIFYSLTNTVRGIKPNRMSCSGN
jgi:hypothetical protein